MAFHFHLHLHFHFDLLNSTNPARACLIRARRCHLLAANSSQLQPICWAGMRYCIAGYCRVLYGSSALVPARLARWAWVGLACAGTRAGWAVHLPRDCAPRDWDWDWGQVTWVADCCGRLGGVRMCGVRMRGDVMWVVGAWGRMGEREGGRKSLC